MSNVPDYFKATNAAYEILSNTYPFSLETNILQIFTRYPNISVHSYTELADKFGLSFEELLDTSSSEYGTTILDPVTDKIQIWYNDTKDRCTVRFTLAHELGHAILKHTKDDDVSRKEASCFARNLLCAVPIIDELEIRSANDIKYVFDVGDLMAEISLNYFSSDRYYIEKHLYNNIRERAIAYMHGYNSVAELYGYTAN